MNKTVFYDYLRTNVFGGRLTPQQFDGIEKILAEWEEKNSDKPDYLIAYILGTVALETGRTMHPVRETFAKSDAVARRRVKHRKYGKPEGPYNHVYYGRGYVQLTWYYNYVNSSEEAGVDLAKYPDKAMDPSIAAKILINGMLDGRFNGRGKGLEYYLKEEKKDYKNARRTVNVTNVWWKVRDLSMDFEKAFELARQAPNEPKEKPPVDGKPMVISTTNISAVGGFLTTMATTLSTMDWKIALPLIILSGGFAFWIIRERWLKRFKFGE